MKYIRTKDGIYWNMLDGALSPQSWIGEPVAQADTIEELCDCYSYDTETTKDLAVARGWNIKGREIFGCIRTNKGLIYVAKMNDKGELELL